MEKFGAHFPFDDRANDRTQAGAAKAGAERLAPKDCIAAALVHTLLHEALAIASSRTVTNVETPDDRKRIALCDLSSCTKTYCLRDSKTRD